jgi:hypothetical protein
MKKLSKPRRSCAVLICLLLTFILSSCGPVHQTVKPTSVNIKEINTLAVVVPSDGTFTVFCERAKATGTGAVLFGIVGAAVSSAYNQSEDEKTAKSISANLPAVDGRAIFVAALEKTLKESAKFKNVAFFEKELKQAERSNFDAVATFVFHDWGIRLVERDPAEKMAVFVEVEANLSVTRKQTVIWDEHDVLIGQGRHYIGEYKQDCALLQKEIDELFAEAGQRKAYSLIYN